MGTQGSQCDHCKLCVTVLFQCHDGVHPSLRSILQKAPGMERKIR